MKSRVAELLSEITAPAPRPDHLPCFQVRKLDDQRAIFVGRDSHSQPCLLIGTSEPAARAPIRLAGIDVCFSIPCRITMGTEGERTEILTTIVCTTGSKEIEAYFAHVAEAIMRIIGSAPTVQSVAEAVRRLVELFQRLSRPATRSVIGLFGELYLIHRSRSPKISVLAWRSTVDDRFDFSIENVRLEVKASSERVRAHNFSLEQCNPPTGTIGVLLSVFVESGGGGLSLSELINRIEHQLEGDADLILRLQETVASTLGETTPRALSLRFDEHLARSSLRAYDLASIPAVRTAIPTEITHVRFRSDLSRVAAADMATLAARSETLRALLPGRI